MNTQTTPNIANAPDLSWEIPSNPRERAVWFNQRFWTTLKLFIESLVARWLDIKPNKWVSFSWIENGYVHANYGAFHVYFPAVVIGSISLSDWKNTYRLKIDGTEKEVDIGVNIVSTAVQQTTWKKISDLLLPPRPSQTLKATVVRKTLHIEYKNII